METIEEDTFKTIADVNRNIQFSFGNFRLVQALTNRGFLYPAFSGEFFCVSNGTLPKTACHYSTGFCFHMFLPNTKFEDQILKSTHNQHKERRNPYLKGFEQNPKIKSSPKFQTRLSRNPPTITSLQA